MRISNTFMRLFGQSPFKPLQGHMREVVKCANQVPKLFEALYAGDQGKVEEARDGVRALETFERTQPDLLITDLAMPLGSGEQLIRKVRAKKADCPIIVITGYAAALGPTDLEALEGCTILEKPIDVEPMLRALQEALPA